MKLFKIYLIAALLIGLSGCGLTATQRKAINDFGTATATTGSLAQKEFTYMRNETITMKGQYLAFIPYGELRDRQKEKKLKDIVTLLQKKQDELNKVAGEIKAKEAEAGSGPDLPLLRSKLQGLMGEIGALVAQKRQLEPDYMQLDDEFSLETVKVREGAAQALQTYGSLLSKLSDDSSSQQVLTAFDDLFAAFKKIPNRTITDDQLNIIGKAVKIIGQWFINAAKKKIIKEVVEACHPQVDKLCELLSDDFDLNTNRLATRFVLITLQLDGESADKYLSADNFNPESILVRSLALKGLKTAKVNTDYYENVLPGVSGSFQEMKKAHDTLRVKLKHDEISYEDIKQFADSLRNVLEMRKLFQDKS